MHKVFFFYFTCEPFKNTFEPTFMNMFCFCRGNKINVFFLNFFVFFMDSLKILSLEELKKISKFSGGVYDFDLSAIFVDYWRPLQNTLIQLGISKLNGLGFNLETLVRANAQMKAFRRSSKAGRIRPHPPIELEGSIQQNNRELIPELVGLLSRIIPKTRSLKTLKFTTMPFGMNEIEILSQSIQQCGSLRTLYFSDIPLYDNGFAKLCEALNRQAIQELTCKNCGLTDAISPVLLNLVETHGRIQKIAEKHAQQNNEKNIGLVCLHILDLSNNELTSKFVEEVEEGVDASPVTTIDISGNKDVDPSKIKSPKFTISTEAARRDLSQSDYEKELLKENDRLKRVVSQLVNGKDVAALRSDLYAVGPRAGELSEFIGILDDMCAAIGADESYVPKPRKKTTKKKPQQSAKDRLYPK